MLKFKMENSLLQFLDPAVTDDETMAEYLVDATELYKFEAVEAYLTDHPPSPRVVYLLMVKAQKALQVEIAKKGGEGKASKLKAPKEKLIKAWSSGNFSSRDICAEQEYSPLGFASFKAARNALTNTPDPDPWPTKKRKRENKPTRCLV